jgi:site-specific recombinase XerD/ribosomal protein L40E
MEDEKKRIFENQIKNIKNSDNIRPENKELFFEYIKFKQSQGLSFNRLNRICVALKPILKAANYDLKTMNENKVQNIVISINSNTKWTDWTKNSNVRVLKNFIRWLNRVYNTGINLEEIKPIKPKNSLMPEYLINSEEFEKILLNTTSPQMKLIIELLYETGARVSEILDLKIQNIEFNSYGAKLYVKGKTGQRVIPIVWYARDLRQFILVHPNKDKPESNLFFIKKYDQMLPFEYPNFRKQLGIVCKRAGINKRIHAHLFRHTRMTELAKTLPEQTLKQLAGWSGSSKMAEVYIHLSQRDVEDSLLQKVYGIKTSEKEDHNSLKICPRCHENNPFFSTICQRCGAPLNEKELIEAELNTSPEKLKEIDGMAGMLMSLLKNNPNLLEQLKTLKK